MTKSLIATGAALSLLVAATAWAVAHEGDTALLAEATVSFDAARRTALEAVPHGRIVEEEIEREDGRLIYSFDIVEGAAEGVMRDVEIDAQTGALLQNVVDDLDDDEGEEEDDDDDDEDDYDIERRP